MPGEQSARASRSPSWEHDTAPHPLASGDSRFAPTPGVFPSPAPPPTPRRLGTSPNPTGLCRRSFRPRWPDCRARGGGKCRARGLSPAWGGRRRGATLRTSRFVPEPDCKTIPPRTGFLPAGDVPPHPLASDDSRFDPTPRFFPSPATLPPPAVGDKPQPYRDSADIVHARRVVVRLRYLGRPATACRIPSPRTIRDSTLRRGFFHRRRSSPHRRLGTSPNPTGVRPISFMPVVLSFVCGFLGGWGGRPATLRRIPSSRMIRDLPLRRGFFPIAGGPPPTGGWGRAPTLQRSLGTGPALRGTPMPAARSIRLRYFRTVRESPLRRGFSHCRRPSPPRRLGTSPNPTTVIGDGGQRRSAAFPRLGRFANRLYAGVFPIADAPSPAPAVGDEPQPYRTMPEVIPPSMAGFSDGGRGEM